MKVISARGKGTRIEVNAPIRGCGDLDTIAGCQCDNEAVDAVAQGA